MNPDCRFRIAIESAHRSLEFGVRAHPIAMQMSRTSIVALVIFVRRSWDTFSASGAGGTRKMQADVYQLLAPFLRRVRDWKSRSLRCGAV